MFLLPLSLREKLNSISSENIHTVDILVHDHVLYILILSKTYLELVQIPLNGNRERYEKKAIFPISACLSLDSNKVCVFALSKRGIHIFHNELEEHTLIEIKLENGIIKSLSGIVILLINNTFYRIEDNKTVKLRISPYFSKVLSFDLIKNNLDILIVYKTHKALSIYNSNGKEILNKFSIQRKIFVDGTNLLVEEKGDIVLFKVTNEGLEQKKRFYLNLEGIQDVWYSSGNLNISGNNKNGYYFYHKDVMYAINSLITNVSEYKNALFCVSNEIIYYIPNDKDAGLQLSGTEYVALKNILDKKYSPFVTRTFDYNEEKFNYLVRMRNDEEIFWRIPLVKTIFKDKILHLPDTEESINGIFLSLLVSQGVKIQIRKLICNGLKYIKNTGSGTEYLKMLEVFTKFNHKIYKVFTTLKIDFNRLWNNFTYILKPEEINTNLLLKCLAIDFHNVDLKLKNSQKAFYEVIRGIFRYKNKLRNSMKDFNILEKDTTHDVVIYFYEMFIMNKDFIEIFHLSTQTGIKPPVGFLEILKENQQTLDDFQDEKSKFISFIENFLSSEDDYKWFVYFLQGEYTLIEYSKKYSKFILHNSLINSSLSNKGLDYFYKGRDQRGIARLLYKLLLDGKKPDRKYFECIGDYVFVVDHKFIGREYLCDLRSNSTCKNVV